MDSKVRQNIFCFLLIEGVSMYFSIEAPLKYCTLIKLSCLKLKKMMVSLAWEKIGRISVCLSVFVRACPCFLRMDIKLKIINAEYEIEEILEYVLFKQYALHGLLSIINLFIFFLPEI